MQLTVEIAEETSERLETLASQEPVAIDCVPHGYRHPVSKDAFPFTSEDVYRLEEELYLEGKA